MFVGLGRLLGVVGIVKVRDGDVGKWGGGVVMGNRGVGGRNGNRGGRG